MGKLSWLGICAVLVIATPSGAATWIVDAENGTDSGTCGGAAISAPPCASLNQALQNASATDVITVIHGAAWGPIFLNGSISISGPPDSSMSIANNGSAPGCIHAAPGSCAAASSTAPGIEIAAGATDVIKLKGFIVNSGASGTSSVHITSVQVLAMTSVTLRSSNPSSLNAMLYDQSNLPTSGTPHQLYLHMCDVAFSKTGGAVWVAPSVPTSVHLSGGELHHAKFGYRSDAGGLSTGNVNTVVDSTEFFSFNTNAVTVVAGGSQPANVSLSRSTISNAANSGLVVSGANASATLYEDVITQTGTGVNNLGGTVYSLGNNEFWFNGTNVSGSLTTNPPSLQ